VKWQTISRIPVQGGKNYRLGAWAKGDGDRPAYFGVSPLDSNGNWLTGYSSYMPYNNSSWTLTEFTYTAHPDTYWVIIHLGVNNSGGFTTTSVCFDDIISFEID